MLPMGIVGIKGVNDDLQVFWIAQEIGIGDIHEDGIQVVLAYVMRIGFLYAEQVVVRYFLFIRPVSLPDVLLQPVDRRMEVQEQVRLDQLLMDYIEETLIKTEFVVGKIDLGKQKAFCKQIVGDGNVLEKVLLLDQVFQLLEPFRHKEQLERKRILLRALVELGQKGIIGK